MTPETDGGAGGGQETGHLNGTETAISFPWLDEFHKEAPGEVTQHKEAEDLAAHIGAANPPEQGGNEQEAEDDFVKLSGVSMDSVAEIDAPGEVGGDAVSVVGQSFEEASDAADADADEDGKDKPIASGFFKADAFLGDFDAEPPSGQAAGDGFAAEENFEFVAVGPVFLNGFDDGQESCSHQRPGQAGEDDPEAAFIAQIGTGEFSLEAGEGKGAGGVAGSLQNLVSGDDVAENVEFDGEGHR